MGIALLYYIAFLIFGFAGMYFTFAPQVKIFEKSGKFTFFMQPILYIFILYALGVIGAYFLTDNSDFIIKPNLLRIILPLLGTAAIYAANFFWGERAKAATLFFFIFACVFIQPMENKFIPFGLNEYVFKCLAVVLFFVFCLYYRVLNVLPHTIVIPTITMLLGISLLSGIGGAPVYLALISSILIGSLLAFLGINLQRVKIEFDSLSCTLLAFFLCNIFMLDMSELSFSSCIIFSMIFWAEFTIAVYNRFLVNKAGNLTQNSHYFAVAQKITLATLMSNIFKVGIVCTFFGWFQLFAVNQYSLPIVAFFVVLWLNSSMGAYLLQPPKTFKQINSEFIAEIKKNIKDTKETISQISNKKD